MLKGLFPFNRNYLISGAIGTQMNLKINIIETASILTALIYTITTIT